MILRPTILIIALGMILFSCNNSSPGEMLEITLDSGWKFRSANETEWLPATVPGCVHTDLMDNGIIEDPFYRLNEHDVQWVDKNDWVYRTTFEATAEMLGRDRVELHFPGLDTYAEVFLNDSLVLRADNMFRHWSVSCKPMLREGENRLEIVLRSPIEEGIIKYDALDYTIPVSDNDLAGIGKVEGGKKVSVFTRKAGYHFGWDWGPRLVTSGIWKPVSLKAWDRATIRDVRVKQLSLTGEEAKLEVTAELEYAGIQSGRISLYINGKQLATRKISGTDLSHFVTLPATIQDPELWWPNGAGEQPLYEFELVLEDAKGVLQRTSTVTGLRSIELVREPDEAGESFVFHINGRPMFMKGANYIPQDVFLNRVTPEKYEALIRSAVAANMNMLRIWGGGIYEKDIFYDLCDRYGILVWQDFMFACSMYPGDSLFLENVRQEAIDNVKRLRNHPSVALWCGNNENLSAWLRWGWKERVIEQQGQEVADLLWEAYEDVFHRILPEVASAFDGSRAYWSSSPSKEMGVPEELTHGDVHYWGVWWGKEPFETFRENTGRFMSEYGFQSFPEMKTIEQYAIPADYNIYSEVMKSHQRSSIGNETIELYMKRDYRDPKDFRSFIYVGQVLQGEGIKRAIQLHRLKMPYCMGSLYWQINDCWPVASWSGRDYYGRWKAMHHKVGDVFKNVIIAPDVTGNLTTISVVSDLAETIGANLHLSMQTLEGELLWEVDTTVEVFANQASEVFSFNTGRGSNSGIPAGVSPNNVVLDVTLVSEGVTLDDEQVYFVKPKFLALNMPEIDLTVSKETLPVRLVLKTNRLAKNVCLESEGGDGRFSNNYFDMLPDRKYEIYFYPHNNDSIPTGFRVRSLADSYTL